MIEVCAVTSLRSDREDAGETLGQFHKAKKFVITKIIFVITNISYFVLLISTVC